MSNNQQNFKDILKAFDDAMLTTETIAGRPHARPMRIAEVTDDCDVWFSTSKYSGKIDEIKLHPQVAITMQGGGKFLSLTGTAEVSEDRRKIEELWSDGWKIWFPEGKNDPSIALIKVNANHGAYWDMSGSNRLRFVYEAGKAWFTGEEVDKEAMEEMSGEVKL